MPAEPPAPSTVTYLLEQVGRGDAGALDQILPLIYAELHQIAERHMARERPDHTLQPTALVNEAFLRLVGGTPAAFNDRTHFLRVASTAMRHVLVDHARRRRTAKRGGIQVTLDDALVGAPTAALDVEALDEALTRLSIEDPRCAEVVDLRFFGGLSIPEVAAVMGTSSATVQRDWVFARSWLLNEMDEHSGPAF